MSVLFKALARATKSREFAAGGAPIGQPSIMRRGGRRPSKKWLLMIAAGVLCVGAGVGGYLFLAADDKPVAPRPARQLMMPKIASPVAPPVAGAPANSAPAAAPEAGHAAPAVVAIPSAEQPVVQLRPMPTATASTAPDSTKTIPAGAVPLTKAPPAAAPILPVEEDLPTLLARLRRQKAEPAMSQPVSVARAARGGRDLVDDEGQNAIRVGVSPQTGQDAARTAYDNLLRGRYDEALASYVRALASEPRSSTLLLGKATALQKLGRDADARKTYNMVLALDPKNREALTNATILMASQAPERALADLRDLRQVNPGFSPIDAEIGAQEAALGNIPAAIEAMGQAVALSPDNGLYRLNLAILQDRADMASDAATSYRAALDLLASGTAGLPLPIEQIRRRLAYLEGR